jgi:hypothetical protein
MIQSAMRVIGVRHHRRLSSSYNLLLHFKLGKLEPKSGMFIGWYSQNTYGFVLMIVSTQMEQEVQRRQIECCLLTIFFSETTGLIATNVGKNVHQIIT